METSPLPFHLSTDDTLLYIWAFCKRAFECGIFFSQNCHWFGLRSFSAFAVWEMGLCYDHSDLQCPLKPLGEDSEYHLEYQEGLIPIFQEDGVCPLLEPEPQGSMLTQQSRGWVWLQLQGWSLKCVVLLEGQAARGLPHRHRQVAPVTGMPHSCWPMMFLMSPHAWGHVHSTSLQ